VLVTISGGDLPHPKAAWTSSFGYFSFNELEAGRTYIVSVVSKRHRFAEASSVVSVSDNVAGLDFVADSPLPSVKRQRENSEKLYRK